MEKHASLKFFLRAIERGAPARKVWIQTTSGLFLGTLASGLRGYYSENSDERLGEFEALPDEIRERAGLQQQVGLNGEANSEYDDFILVHVVGETQAGTEINKPWAFINFDAVVAWGQANEF